MVRPWYRSVLFWLGWPGLIFLVWAWVATKEKTVFHVFHVGGDGLSLASCAGQIHLERQVDPFARVTFHHYSYSRPGILEIIDQGWFPPAVTYSGAAKFTDPLPPPRTLRIAYWFMILVYLMLFISVIGLRQYRIRKLAQAHGQATNSTL